MNKFYIVLASLTLAFTIGSSQVQATVHCTLDFPQGISESHISYAVSKARDENREVHVVFGVLPWESHMADLKQSEDQAVAPLRIFFSNGGYFAGLPHHEVPKSLLQTEEGKEICHLSSREQPVFIGDFNNKMHITRFFSALSKSVDKLYFDLSVAKFCTWDVGKLNMINSVMKPKGKMFVPEMSLASEARFSDQGGEDCLPMAQQTFMRGDYQPLLCSAFYGFKFKNFAKKALFNDLTGHYSDPELVHVSGGMGFEAYPDIGFRFRDQANFEKSLFDEEYVQKLSTEPLPFVEVTFRPNELCY